VFFITIASINARHLALYEWRATEVSLYVLSHCNSEVDKLAVLVLAGGAGFSGSVVSVGELRAHAQTIRGLKSLPPRLFSEIDNLGAQEADQPGKHITANIWKLALISGLQHMLTVNQRPCTD
jgi:hypothetical protein